MRPTGPGRTARVVKDGVTVNAVAPSLIATEMIKPHRLDNVSRIPVDRLGTVDEIALVVLMVVGSTGRERQAARAPAVERTPGGVGRISRPGPPAS
jgi:NAD(P)-dependent dehydrogenase (short-subunit alcohol dehydrogenase family)